jgi:hypothetical protein
MRISKDAGSYHSFRFNPTTRDFVIVDHERGIYPAEQDQNRFLLLLLTDGGQWIFLSQKFVNTAPGFRHREAGTE